MEGELTLNARFSLNFTKIYPILNRFLSFLFVKKFFKNIIDLQCYNAVLVSGVQLSDSVIQIVFFLIKKKLFWPFKASALSCTYHHIPWL